MEPTHLTTLNEITIIYKIKDEKIIKLFGENFVNNNKSNCKIFVNNKYQEIYSDYKVEKENTLLEIKLKEINIIRNMSYMFYECKSLYELPDISQ